MENLKNAFEEFKLEIERRLRYPADFAVLDENEQREIEMTKSGIADELMKEIEKSTLTIQEKQKLYEMIQDKY